MPRKQSRLVPLHPVVPCSWDGGLSFSNQTIAPAPSSLSQPHHGPSPIHAAAHKLWVIVLSSLRAKSNVHTCSFHRNQHKWNPCSSNAGLWCVYKSTRKEERNKHPCLSFLSALLVGTGTCAPSVVCLFIPACQGVPQRQVQPLLSSRGSITSQTCPSYFSLLEPLLSLGRS